MELNIPTAYNEVNLGTYQHVARLITERAQIEDAADAVQHNIEILAALTQVDAEALGNVISFPMLNQLLQKLAFLNDLPKPKMIATFECHGKRFTVLNTVQKISAGDFIDLLEFQKDIEGNMHSIMGIICREEGVEYTTEGAMSNADLFKKHLTADIAIGVSLFFCNFFINCVEVTRAYLAATSPKERRAISKKLKGVGTARNMAGFSGLIDLQGAFLKIKTS
jgi:hypothetical protein